MFIVQQMVHRFRPPNLISRATPMKNLIKSTPQTVKRGIFHNRSTRFNACPRQTDFFLRQILAEISDFIINSVIKVVGRKNLPVPGDEIWFGQGWPEYSWNAINSIMSRHCAASQICSCGSLRLIFSVSRGAEKLLMKVEDACFVWPRL